MNNEPYLTRIRQYTARLVIASGLAMIIANTASAFDDANHQAITRDAGNGWTTSATTSSFTSAVLSPDYAVPYVRLSKAHCDNCTWSETADWIETHRQKAALAAFRYNLTQASADYQDFVNHFGFILHATEDHYSHSNWIETHPLNLLVNLSGPKPTGWLSGTYDNFYDVPSARALCTPGTPTHEQLNKDAPSRPGFSSAYQDAVLAVQDQFRIFQEFVRASYGSQADTILTKVGFINLKTHIRLSGAITYPSGKMYFFRGSEYFRYNPAISSIDAGYPLPIVAPGSWPGVWADGIDAAVTWNNGKTYFFKGDNYIQYDIARDAADAGYPRTIVPDWPGVWVGGINAVINVDNRKAYFFRGSEYIQYDIATRRADSGYPHPIAGNWPGLWEDGVDAAVYTGNGKVHFFKGAFYLRYDLNLRKMDFASPLPIASSWKGVEVR